MPIQKPDLNLVQVTDGHFIPAEDGQSQGLFQVITISTAATAKTSKI